MTSLDTVPGRSAALWRAGVIGVVLVGAATHYGLIGSTAARPRQVTAAAPAPIGSQPIGAPRRFVDSLGYFGDTQGHYEEFLTGIAGESGVDIRIETVAGVPDGDLETYALRAMRERGIGRDAGGRGLLIVYDTAAQRMRIEVGEGLQGVFPDGYVGYLMRAHAASYFATSNRSLGLRSTLFMVTYRLREAALHEPYDPRLLARIEDRHRLASGGGATGLAGSRTSRPMFLGRPSSPADRLRFGAAPTPAVALERYHEWLSVGDNMLDVPLFTESSAQAVAGFPQTQAYHEYILYTELGQRFEVIERGDLALLAFTSTPLVSPHFLRRTADGWQIDIAAEIRNTQEKIGGYLTWRIRESGDDYTSRFADDYIHYENHSDVRVRGGDNRPLPIPEAGPVTPQM